MHVLLSSYACHPVEGSEPGVGWHLLLGALAVADRVTLVTRRNNIQDVQEALSPEQLTRCTIVAYDLHPIFVRLKRRLPLGTQAYYSVWQIKARSLVRRLHAQTPFDVAHHATFAVDWAPTAISSLPEEVAKVWGPVGGATLCPRPLLLALGPWGLLKDTFRVMVCSIGRAANGRVNARASAVVIAQNTDDAKAFRRFARRLDVEPNAFLDSSTLPTRVPENVDDRLIVGVGRLIPLKGWSIALRVLAQLPDSFRLEIYGSGADLPRLESLARRLGVEERVGFMGHRARNETYQAVARARCVLFSSLHDSAPGAVAEAVAIGTPVVCIGIGGTGEILAASNRGTAINPYSEDVVGLLAKAVTDAASRSSSPTRRWDSSRVPTLVANWYNAATEEGGSYGDN